MYVVLDILIIIDGHDRGQASEVMYCNRTLIMGNLLYITQVTAGGINTELGLLMASISEDSGTNTEWGLIL